MAVSATLIRRALFRSLKVLPEKIQVGLERLLPIWATVVLECGDDQVLLRTSPRDDSWSFALEELPSHHESEGLRLWGAIIEERAGLVIDVGSYQGVFSLVASMRGAEKVIAFEPNPVARKLWRKNLELNRVGNVPELVPFALGEREGEASLVSPKFRRASSSAQFRTADSFHDIDSWVTLDRVKTVSLDSFLSGRGLSGVSAIKLDVEGFELSALRGAREILQLDRPVLLFEALDMQRLKHIEDFLRTVGYVVVQSIPSGSGEQRDENWVSIHVSDSRARTLVKKLFSKRAI